MCLHFKVGLWELLRASDPFRFKESVQLRKQDFISLSKPQQFRVLESKLSKIRGCQALSGSHLLLSDNFAGLYLQSISQGAEQESAKVERDSVDEWISQNRSCTEMGEIEINKRMFL
mmetsp:Transcript_18881/g.32249  ORF Transcript_18881/g.32249 Transcript_18881/m.32249 type:complete len:117 (-) Transcript_18881:12-362(-)